MEPAFDLDHGTFQAVVPDILDGRPIRRLMFCLRARGCAHAFRGDGPCTMCGFTKSSAQDQFVPPEKLKLQFDNMMASVDLQGQGIEEVDLFCAGSFFNDEEIDVGVRAYVLSSLGMVAAVRKVLVESRPEYVTRERVAAALDCLGDTRLEVAVGLESADDRVREEVIRKGFSRADFERALEVLAAHPVQALVYLLIKPPSLSEAEAIADAEASGRYVFACGRRFGLPVVAAFQPTFVQAGTVLDELYRKGEYRPPWLWSVIEVVRRVHGLGEIQIGSAEDDPPPYAARANCGACDARCEDALRAYNQTLDVSVFDRLDCSCYGRWRDLVADRAEPIGSARDDAK